MELSISQRSIPQLAFFLSPHVSFSFYQLHSHFDFPLAFMMRFHLEVRQALCHKKFNLRFD